MIVMQNLPEISKKNEFFKQNSNFSAFSSVITEAILAKLS